MQVDLSADQSILIKSLIASGRYSTAEQVIAKALESLTAQEAEFEAAIADVNASLDDERAGRLASIHDVAARIRTEHGLARPS
jgi:putative addiction module CopG family antidote